MVDTIFGVSLALLLHKLVLYSLQLYLTRRYWSLAPDDSMETPKIWQEHVVRCGDYGSPPSLYPWTLQMIEWVTNHNLYVYKTRTYCVIRYW